MSETGDFTASFEGRGESTVDKDTRLPSLLTSTIIISFSTCELSKLAVSQAFCNKLDIIPPFFSRADLQEK